MIKESDIDYKTWKILNDAVLNNLVSFVLRFSYQFFQWFQSSYYYQHPHAVFDCVLFFF